MLYQKEKEMSDDFRKQLHRNFNQKTTDELIEIWQTNDRVEWSEMTFDVVREILQDRGVDIPPQDEPITEESEKSRLGEFEAVSMTIPQILFSFKGRIGRGTYWLGAFFITGFVIAASLVDVAFYDYTRYSGIPTILGRLLVLWPGLALTVKRWHDRDKSGWWTLINIIPYIGPLWSFIENGLLPGTNGPNQYGSKSF